MACSTDEMVKPGSGSRVEVDPAGSLGPGGLPVGDELLVGLLVLDGQFAFVAVQLLVVVAGSAVGVGLRLVGGEFQCAAFERHEAGPGERVVGLLGHRFQASTTNLRAVATTAIWNPRRCLIRW